jgi:ATP-dependent helicase HrpA
LTIAFGAIVDSLREIERNIASAMIGDQHRLRGLLRAVRRGRQRRGESDRRWRQLVRELEQSIQRRQTRASRVPGRTYDNALPINARRDEIAAAIQHHQVVVVCGETGSGKSTQLPKVCLDIGRGIGGMIGHTQPRRIAARAVAARIAEELGTSVGRYVGYKVRFTDQTSPDTYIKLMTDGMLLAETQQDRFLDQYDVIIVDEAHERSLNIDFLLGYLHRLLPKRRDLRLVITSATIDADRFAEHFRIHGSPAPVIEVSGRTYPVEVRYRTFGLQDDEDEPDLAAEIVDAIHEMFAERPGDTLVFLPTERDIRDVTKTLRGRLRIHSGTSEIIPLYARLPTAQQNKVFQPQNRTRIVLATNVAESSLTVPGIRYVVDVGTARISRYSPRSKVQRLPIEPVSRASAEQRKGRCGRVGPGICVRLYSEDDYLSRDEYTTPEIRRTNLAAVILQMLALKLGAVDEFPFLDPPRADAIRDGYKTLFELGAIDHQRRLTDIGRRLSRLPVDPRIGRLVLAGHDEDCLHEILIIASAMEIQDPRERPAEKEKLADAKHAPLNHQDSDFLTYLKLWDLFHDWKTKLSRSQLRKACQQNYLSYNRMREWQDVHRQLLQLAKQDDLKVRPRRDDYDAIHRALLTGLLSNIAMRRDKFEYQGSDGGKFYLWPGSTCFAQPPKWVVAGELVETRRRYLRTAAKIQVKWIEPLAEHLVKRSHSEAFWSRKSGTVLAREKVTLFGLTLVSGRRVPYGVLNPQLARQLFIQHALIEGDFDSRADFFIHNRQLVKRLHESGIRSRRSEFLVGDGVQTAFYEARLPETVYDAASLRRWLREASPHDTARLKMAERDLIHQEAQPPSLEAFPSEIPMGSLNLDVDYCFQPGEEHDGISVTVPCEAVNQLDAGRLEWLVPGLLEEKLTALIRCLPKSIRRDLVPAAESARRVAAELHHGQGDFLSTAAKALSRIAEQPIPVEAFQLDRLPHHLRVNVRVIDDHGKILRQSRDVDDLRQANQASDSPKANVVVDRAWQRDGLTTWDFGDLPRVIAVRRGDYEIEAFPALADCGDSVSLRLLDNPDSAMQATRGGMRRLFAIAENRELESQVHWLPRLSELELFASTMRHTSDLRSQLADLLAQRAFVDSGPLPRSAMEFESARKRGRAELPVAVQDVAMLITPLLETYHQACCQLDDATSPQWQDSVHDIRDQLNELTAQGYLVQTPWDWLNQYPRYFRAMIARLERLRAGGLPRDRQAMEQLSPFLSLLAERRQDFAARGIYDRDLEDYRWMLEEFRVSLFAQQLGTRIKISPQRLEKQWAKVRRA